MGEGEPGSPNVIGVSHVGLCVSNFDLSLRFYTEGLGFECAEGWDIPSAMAPLAEVPRPMECRSQMLVRGATKIELLGWRIPVAEGQASTRRNQIGFTHLSVLVEDIRACADRLVELGGSRLAHTEMHIPMPNGTMHVLFVGDPDGVRIELMQQATESTS